MPKGPRHKAPQGPRHKAPKGPRYTILDTLKQFRQPEPPINRSTTRTRTRPRTSGPGTRPYSRAYASGPEPDLTPDARGRRTTESSSSSSSSSSPSFVVIVVVVSPSHWGAGAAEEVAADLKTKEKLAKQDAVQEVPKSQKGRRTRASGDRTWRWAWVPQEGGSLRPRDPQ